MGWSWSRSLRELKAAGYGAQDFLELTASGALDGAQRAAQVSAGLARDAQQFWDDHEDEIRAGAEVVMQAAAVAGRGAKVVFEVLGEMGESGADTGGGYISYDG